MQRLEAVILRKDLQPTLHAVAALGIVQLSPPLAATANPVAPTATSTEPLARCDRLRTTAAQLRESLVLPANAPTSSAHPLPSLPEAEHDLQAFEQTASRLLLRRGELVAEQSRLTAERARVAPFCGANVPLGAPTPDRFLRVVSGFVPRSAVTTLETALDDSAVLLVLNPADDPVPVVIATTRRHRAALTDALHTAGFQEQTWTHQEEATPETIATRNQAQLEGVASQIDAIQRELETLSEAVAPSLPRLEETAEITRRLTEAERLIPQTSSSALLTGWVPTDAAPRITGALKSCARGCVIERWTSATTDDDPPVLLRCPDWMRAFQRLVEAYGLPRYHERDPTAFLAVSYVLMFGLMFGDVGHGAILSAVGIGIAFRTRRPAWRDVGILLTFLGASSFAFGWLYGSFFGLPGFKEHAVWQDPIEGDPMPLMVLTLGIGAVLISLGLLLNVVNRFAEKDTAHAILGRSGILGILFYWGAIAWLAATSSAASENPGPSPWIPALLAIPCAGWLLAEPCARWQRRRRGNPAPTESLWMAIGESVVHAMEAVVAFLANTVSFLRLAAYAMSHAALLAAVWMVATQLTAPSDPSPVAAGVPPAVEPGVSPGGIPIHTAPIRSRLSATGIVILVLGNAFVIALEGTIAAVQALRLEYHEFFGRFLSGTGKRFQPLEIPRPSPA